jgi:putative membrane protein
MLLATIWALNAVAIFGYAVFVRNPEFLALHPIFPEIFGQSYQFFSRASVLIAFLAIAVELVRDFRFKWLLSFALVVVISAGAELLGTSTGLPFGPYEYTALLGPKIANLVPWLIPLSWYTMAIPSFIIARQIISDRRWSAVVSRILLASLILVHWDLTLDPAMSQLTPFWIWGTTGPYYGTPLLNLFGWFVVSLLIMAALEVTVGRWRFARPRWHWNFYLANLVLPYGICLAAGLWLAVALSTGFMIAIIWADRSSRAPSSHPLRLSKNFRSEASAVTAPVVDSQR